MTSTAPGPGVGSLPRFGPALVREDPVDVAVDLRAHYGHVVRIPPLYPGLDRAAYLVTHPEDVRTVLQTRPDAFRGLEIPGSEGFAASVEGSILGPPGQGGLDWWVTRLRRIAPEFSEHAVAGSVRPLVRATLTTLDEFGPPRDPTATGRPGRARRPGASSGARTRRTADPATPVDAGPGTRLQPLCARLALRLLGTSLFVEDLRRHEADVVRAVARLRRAYKRRTYGVLLGAVERRLPDRVSAAVEPVRRRLAPGWVDHDRTPLDVLAGVADTMVARRERVPGAFDDAIATWLTRPDPTTGETMAPAAVRAEVAGQLIAGYATVSAALTWAIVLLAAHPAVQDRLHEEARASRVLGTAPVGAPESADEPGYDDLIADLPVAHRVWQETLRRYPPLPVFGRMADEAVTLGGYRVPPDAPVLLSPYVTHRDPAFWDDPDRFDPERFRPERARGRPAFAYYPFSAGPSGCLGRHVATVEAVVALSTVCRAYRVERVGDPAPVGVDSAIDLEPDRDVRVRLVPRPA